MTIETVNHKRYVTHDGIRDTYAGWAKRLNISPKNFRHRVSRVMNGEMQESSLFRNGCREQIFATHNGVTLGCAEWARRLGITHNSMKNRIARFNDGAMSESECFRVGQQPKTRTVIEYNGRQYTIAGLARKLDVSPAIISNRLKYVRQGTLAPERLFTKGKIADCDRDRTNLKHYTLSDGTKVSLLDLAEKAQVSFGTIKRMIERGMSVDEIADWSKDPNRRIKSWCFVEGVKRSIADLAHENGIERVVVTRRCQSGWDFQDALQTPKLSHREAQVRGIAARKRNQRLADLKRMGIAV